MQENALNGDLKPKVSHPFQLSAYMSVLLKPLLAHSIIPTTTTDGYACLQRIASTPPPQSLRDDKRFDPWFKNCLGAIDGTFIPLTYRSRLDHARYRTKKKILCINVLACCTFDLRFCYIHAGWEGSANDHRVYEEAVAADFRIPQGRFYLADAG